MYKCLQNNSYSKGYYSIKAYRKEDIFKIKDWRNEQIDVLRQARPLTDQDQLNYYEKVVASSFSEETPRIILFSFLHNDLLIGYGGLTNNDWVNKRSEISFLIDTSRGKQKEVYKEDFLTFLELMKMVAFEDIKFNRLFTETFDIRPFHISILEESGFKLEGRMKEHVLINNKFYDSLIHGFLKSYYGVKK